MNPKRTFTIEEARKIGAQLGVECLDIGDRVRVQLTSIDVERGFIDFKPVGRSRH